MSSDDDEEKETNKKQKPIWHGLPPVPDASTVVGDLSCHGSLGSTLHEALHQVQADLAAAEDDDRTQLSDTHIARIVQSFGESIAQTQVDQRESCHDDDQAPPAALIKARIDHYNRYGRKWRIVVKDAQLQARKTLDRNRRKRERPSLWQQQDRSTTKLGGKRLEILAYNDLP